MTTKDLYDALIQMPDLHSLPQLQDQVLVWHLYKNAYVQAYCHDTDGYIALLPNSVFRGSVMHWHPDAGEMLNFLYALGKRDNLLVLKKTLFATHLFYLGAATAYPLSQKQGLHLGRKKWDGGSLLCFEQV